MFVAKRDGRKEPVMFDKITARIRKLCYGLNKLVDPTKVAMRVIEGLYDGVTTSELDNLAAETAATMTVQHPDSVSIAVDRILSLVEPSKETYKFYLIHFLNEYAKSKFVGMDAVYVHLGEKYYCCGMCDLRVVSECTLVYLYTVQLYMQ